MISTTTTLVNPTDQGPKPPFPKQTLPYPGLEAQMQPKPDYGEQSYQGHGRLQGRAALITGGDSGIGRAVALAFAREGADVLISYLNEEPDAQETIQAITAAGRKGIAVSGDIGEPGHCRQLIERAQRELGHLDILVNNAAYQMARQSIADITPDELKRTFSTNIFAMFYLCQAALPIMPEGGAIINTASIEGYQPKASLIDYATTKGAIITFTKALAEEAIKRGIRVNAVAPGPVWTPLIPASMPAEQTANFGQNTPMGRPAQPVELAPAYVFLAADEARFITGEVIGVTGGRPIS